jgi:hypothetical protein
MCFAHEQLPFRQTCGMMMMENGVTQNNLCINRRRVDCDSHEKVHTMCQHLQILSWYAMLARVADYTSAASAL